jgi:hypothetical protein
MTEDDLYILLNERYPDLTRPNDQYSLFDASSPAAKAIFELKCRRTHYDELLLEKPKFDKFVDLGRVIGMTPYYVCSTPKGIYQYDLTTIDPEWQVKEMPTTTDFYRKAKIDKVVAFVHIDQSIQW